MADGASVTDDAGVAHMVKATMDAWGRIDILVANAGILRDKSFANMALADFQFVLDVHLMGTVKPTKAVWEIMKAQNYGRIIVTTSSTGLYGNFGQANYGAAKLSLIGFMNTIKIVGKKNNVHINGHRPGRGDADDGKHPAPADRRPVEAGICDAGRRLLGVGGGPNRRDPDRRRRHLRAGSHVRDARGSISAKAASPSKRSATTGPRSPIPPANRPTPTAACRRRSSSPRRWPHGRSHRPRLGLRRAAAGR